MTSIYRTLVHGKLVQRSGLCAGGAGASASSADLACARDGKGRLTLAGSGLAGALIETAGRICHTLLQKRTAPMDWDRVSAKARLKPDRRRRKGRREENEEKLFQSLWHFWPAHLEGKVTELRQGVGIRQATGATAAKGRALFDIETIPAEQRWDLFFEVDTRRGGHEIEALALLALWEWTQGRCWLGSSAARGLGWMQLEDVEVLRLPLTKDVIDAWPNNRNDRNGTWEELKKLVEPIQGADNLRKKALELWPDALKGQRFWYLTLEASVQTGVRADGYGLDSLSVGGHAAGYLEPLKKGLLRPLGVREDVFVNEYSPDAPVVTTQPGGESAQPFLPGSGLRGPLRHAATRWWKGQQPDQEIPDPNEVENGGRCECDAHPVSLLFGLVGHSARLLVRDGYLKDGNITLACLQHHAEDEFTAGVYGSGKFDRTAVLKGGFILQLVIEGKDEKELRQHIETLRPVLQLAELGYVPLGGAKWRGHGWVPWQFTDVSLNRAGEPAMPFSSPTGTGSIIDSLARVLQQLGAS